MEKVNKIREEDINHSLPFIQAIGEIKDFCEKAPISYNLNLGVCNSRSIVGIYAFCRLSKISGIKIGYSLDEQENIIIEDTPAANKIEELITNNINGSLQEVAQTVSFPNFKKYIDDNYISQISRREESIEVIQRGLRKSKEYYECRGNIYKCLFGPPKGFSSPSEWEDLEDIIKKNREEILDIEQTITECKKTEQVITPADYVSYAVHKINLKYNVRDIDDFYSSKFSYEKNYYKPYTRLWMEGTLTLSGLEKLIKLVNPDGKIQVI